MNSDKSKMNVKAEIRNRRRFIQREFISFIYFFRKKINS